MTLPPLSNRRLSSEVEMCGQRAPWSGDGQLEQLRLIQESATPPDLISSIELKPLRGEEAIREAILLTFCDPLSRQCSQLQHLSLRNWQNLLRWLDISGLALYFLDRIVELQLCHWLPSAILNRLQQNLKDNAERTRGMIAESIAIQQRFQEARLFYAKLKGLSLWPGSVSRPELRSQFDSDFLVTAESAPRARQILEDRGYRLYAVSGRSWEFKRNEKPGISLKDLYKASPSHTVELHIESPVPGHSSLLDRVEWRDLYGLTMPVLSSVDLFLGQGMHAHKHVCSEFSRAAHLLEFRRHILARRHDYVFWKEVQSRAHDSPRASLGIGVVTLLSTRVMGDFAPKALTSWTVECLPQSARLWIEMYGRRVVLGNFPGNKLYLLLQRQLEFAGLPAKRSIRQALLPSRLPPPVMRAFPNETFSVRLARYRMQVHFVFLRLRFHIVEGVRYLWETHRWRRSMNRLAR